MDDKKIRSGQTPDLRMRAEEIARGKAAPSPENLEGMSHAETRQVLHELRVHQIELEMQNEELRRAQAELDAERAQYFDLYDLAPVGYCTLSEQGLILKANLTAASMLGLARSDLVRQPLSNFIHPTDQDAYYRHWKLLFETRASQVNEMRMLKKDGEPFWVRMSTTVVQDANGQPACRSVKIDITDRKHAEESLLRTLGQLRRAIETTIQVLVMAVEVKDPYTAGHQRRVANLAWAMAREMDLPPDKIEGIRMAGVIHDIGKITVPTEILSKPTRLSDIEFSLIKEHVQTGHDILKDVESPWPLAKIVLQHHERMDGSGYPGNLKGEEILIEARVLAVADVVEAMASYRPYRPALGIDAALGEIEKNRGILYDPAAVDACLILFRERGYTLLNTYV